MKHLPKAALGNKIYNSTAEQSSWSWPLCPLPASPCAMAHKLPVCLCLCTFFFSPHLPSSPVRYSHSFLLKQLHVLNISLISERLFSTHWDLKPAVSSSDRKKRLYARKLVYLL